MYYIISWLSVLTGMIAYGLIHDSISAEEVLAAAWFGGCMLAGHWCITRATTSRPVNRNVG